MVWSSLFNGWIDGYFVNIWFEVIPLRMIYSLRSMAVFSGRSAVAPVSSRFLCPRPPLLLCVQNQNRRATQATAFKEGDWIK